MMTTTAAFTATPRLLFIVSLSLSAVAMRQKNAMAFLSLYPMMGPPRIPRILPVNQLGNMWWNEYDDYEEVDEYYYTELPSPPKSIEDRPAVKMSAPIVSRPIPDPSLDDYYSPEDNDYLDMEEEEDAASSAPGNFWINPSPSPDRTKDRRRSTARPPLRKSAIRSGAGPKPPPPLIDFYNRLFWYGLDPLDDFSGEYENEAESEKRTMFGGTKGKFNGLSFLSDAVGVVAPAKQRPYRRRSSQEDALVDPEEDLLPYGKDTTQRRRVPVTPPYDPPRMPIMNGEPANEASSRRKQTKRQQSIMNIDDETGEPLDDLAESPYDNDERLLAPDDTRSWNGRPSSSKRGRSRGRQGDWATSTVSAWFENEEVDDTRSSIGESSRETSAPPRRRSRTRNVQENDRDGSFQYPPVLQSFTGALEAFIGVDREEQQRPATEYDVRKGFTNRRRNGTRTPPKSSEPHGAAIAEPRNTPEEALDLLDAEPIPVMTRTQDETDELGQAASKLKPLTWEERALAIERVPPAGMAAWGPEGEIHNMDARTKALQDAIVDIKLIQTKIKNYEQLILDLEDEMSILKIDIELERRKLHHQHLEQAARSERRPRSTSNQRLMDRIRNMELEFENESRKLRYLRIRKSRAEQDSLDLNRRHWALFHCMKQIVAQDTLSKQMEDILLEFNDAEPAARLYTKTGERIDASSDPLAVVATDDDPLVSLPSSSAESESAASNY